MTPCAHPQWALRALFDGYLKSGESCELCNEILHVDPEPAPREWVHCDWCTRVIVGLRYYDEDEMNLALEFGDTPRKFCGVECLRSAVRWAVRHRQPEPQTLRQLAGED